MHARLDKLTPQRPPNLAAPKSYLTRPARPSAVGALDSQNSDTRKPPQNAFALHQSHLTAHYFTPFSKGTHAH